MMDKKRSRERFRVIILIAALSLFLAFILDSMVLIESIQLKTVNTLFNLRGPATPQDTTIVIIAIDDQTLRSLPGKLPYPRSYYAKLVNNLRVAGAKMIIFDIEFTEVTHERPDEDLQLAAAVSDMKQVVLAGKVVLDIGSRLSNNEHVLEPIQPLMRTQAVLGLVNVPEDGDGFIRRYLLFQPSGQRVYYSLGVQAARLLSGHSMDTPPDLFTHAFELGLVEIPKVQDNTMYINFRGPARTFRTYSLVSVLDDSTFDLPGDEDTDIFDQYLEWGTFRDKIVFVGATAEEMQDNKFTPFFEYSGLKQKMPGVELHANALSTMIRGDFIHPSPEWLVYIIAVLLALMAGLFMRWMHGVRALAMVLFIAFLYGGMVYAGFAFMRVLVPLSVPLLTLAVASVSHLAYQIVVEQREKARIRQTFQQYVAPAVVAKMLDAGELPSYGGERKELTVLFSDIRSFTRFSENNEPEVVVSRLSDYLSEMVDVIFKYNGTLDKFVGDEIMALFGAPYHYEDHAMRACQAALEMLQRLKELHKAWPDEAYGRFNIGIGINTGKMIVGNLGSKQLFDYTVIGDQVNLASRLEGANKEYQTNLIISESTYQCIKDKSFCRELDQVKVVGKSQAIRIFELRSMDSLPQLEQDYLIDIYSEGLYAYRERRWSDALISFRKVLRYFPNDGPSRIYTIRCLNYLEAPAPSDWDGIYEMKQK